MHSQHHTNGILLILLLLAAACAGDSNQKALVIQVISPAVPDSATVYIAGSDSALGGWHPARVALARQADGSWMKRIHFPSGTTLQFKFTLGDWSREALAADSTLPGNHTLTLRNDTTVIYQIDAWRDEHFHQRVQGQITGTVRYHLQVAGDGLKPRDVIVWLPPGYETDLQRRYPVLYMHDGQNIFDPQTSAFGRDWRVDEVTDSLIRAGEIEPPIVVGLYNTPDRSLEYSDTTLGRAYMAFLTGILKPLIDRTYRTRPEREHTATMGSSMGGLIAFLLVWEHPETFSAAGCLSPAFIYQDWKSIRQVNQYRGAKKDIRIYIDNGGIGVEDTLQAGCNAMLKALTAQGFREGENLQWFFDPRAEHNEPAWARRVWRPLNFMFGK